MIKFNSKLNLLFSSSYDDTLRSWRFDEAVDDWLQNYTMKGHKSTVWAFDFDPTEQFLVSVSEDRELLIWMISA